jgi:hypothetical protein
MKKIFLFVAAALCSAVMFAEEISEINLTVVFPEAGAAVISGEEYFPSTDNLATFTYPAGAKYYCESYVFELAGGYSFDETEFQENTAYTIWMVIVPTESNSFIKDGEFVDLNNMTILINGEPRDNHVWDKTGKAILAKDFTTGNIPTAIDNTAVDAKAVKRVVNGQLFIERDGKTFNALGVEVK